MNKNTKFLVIVLFALGFLAYKFAISKTLSAYKELHALEVQQQKQQQTHLQLQALLQQEQSLDSLIKKQFKSTSPVQYQLLEQVNRPKFASPKDAKNYKVLRFDAPHRFLDTQTGVTTQTFCFTLQGSYRALIQVLYALEQTQYLGKVTSTYFKTHQNYKTGVKSLRCTVYVQVQGVG